MESDISEDDDQHALINGSVMYNELYNKFNHDITRIVLSYLVEDLQGYDWLFCSIDSACENGFDSLVQFGCLRENNFVTISKCFILACKNQKGNCMQILLKWMQATESDTYNIITRGLYEIGYVGYWDGLKILRDATQGKSENGFLWFHVLQGAYKGKQQDMTLYSRRQVEKEVSNNDPCVKTLLVEFLNSINKTDNVVEFSLYVDVLKPIISKPIIQTILRYSYKCCYMNIYYYMRYKFPEVSV